MELSENEEMAMCERLAVWLAWFFPTQDHHEDWEYGPVARS